jgi:hypothetical protein
LLEANGHYRICELSCDAQPLEEEKHEKCTKYLEKRGHDILFVNHKVRGDCLDIVRKVNKFRFCSTNRMRTFLAGLEAGRKSTIVALTCQRR